MSVPIPNCPMPETAIRQRAWAPGQARAELHGVQPMNALPNYDTWKLATPYDDDGPEPSDEHADEAFDLLVADSDLLADFCMDEQPDYTTILQLAHANGLPRNDGSPRDDGLREAYRITLDGFFEHYRNWLGDRLTNKAQMVMEAEIEQSRIDAAEARAESRDW